jgi:hypothetical protein
MTKRRWLSLGDSLPQVSALLAIFARGIQVRRVLALVIIDNPHN